MAIVLVESDKVHRHFQGRVFRRLDACPHELEEGIKYESDLGGRQRLEEGVARIAMGHADLAEGGLKKQSLAYNLQSDALGEISTKYSMMQCRIVIYHGLSRMKQDSTTPIQSIATMSCMPRLVDLWTAARNARAACSYEGCQSSTPNICQ